MQKVIYIPITEDIGIRKPLNFPARREGILSTHLGKRCFKCWGQKWIVIYFSMGRQHAHNFSTVFPCCMNNRASCPKFSQHQHDKWAFYLLLTQIFTLSKEHNTFHILWINKENAVALLFLSLYHVLRIHSSSSENHERLQKIWHRDKLSDSYSTYMHRNP